MHSIPGLVIHAPATESDLAEGLAFLEASYQQAFGVLPSPPEHLLVARKGCHLLGVLGINFWQQSGGLRLAHLYEFDYADAPLAVNLSKTVEFCRWASKTAGVSGPLVYAAVCFALSRAMAYVWCEHTLAVNRACRRFGIVFHEMPNARLNPLHVEKQHQAFYERHVPHLYMFELAQAKKALEAYLQQQ